MNAREILEEVVGGPVREDVDLPQLAVRLSNATSQERQNKIREEQEQAFAAAEERYATTALKIGSRVLGAVLRHHQPRKTGMSYLDPIACYGCDGTDYDGEHVEWPCSTFKLIEEAMK